jgi:hypothetical protein
LLSASSLSSRSSLLSAPSLSSRSSLLSASSLSSRSSLLSAPSLSSVQELSSNSSLFGPTLLEYRPDAPDPLHNLDDENESSQLSNSSTLFKTDVESYSIFPLVPNDPRIQPIFVTHFEELYDPTGTNPKIGQKEGAIITKQKTLVDEPQNPDGASSRALLSSIEANGTHQHQWKFEGLLTSQVAEQPDRKRPLSRGSETTPNTGSPSSLDGRLSESVKQSDHSVPQEVKSSDDESIDASEDDGWDGLSFGYGRRSTCGSDEGSFLDSSDEKGPRKRCRLQDEVPETEKILHWQESVPVSQCTNGQEGSVTSSQTSRNSSQEDRSSNNDDKGKRKHSDTPDEISGDGDGHNRESKRRRPDPSSDDRRLKCPFYQRQPNRRWPNSCRGNGWLTMKDLM